MARLHEHQFDNLIALCPNCHTRFDKGEIDRKAMLQYKATLAVVNGRYEDIEKRILSHFARTESNRITLPANITCWYYLVQDGFLVRHPADQQNIHMFMGGLTHDIEWQLTPGGRDFVRRWASAQGLD